MTGCAATWPSRCATGLAGRTTPPGPRSSGTNRANAGSPNPTRSFGCAPTPRSSQPQSVPCACSRCTLWRWRAWPGTRATRATLEPATAHQHLPGDHDVRHRRGCRVPDRGDPRDPRAGAWPGSGWLWLPGQRPASAEMGAPRRGRQLPEGPPAVWPHPLTTHPVTNSHDDIRVAARKKLLVLHLLSLRVCDRVMR